MALIDLCNGSDENSHNHEGYISFIMYANNIMNNAESNANKNNNSDWHIH